MGAVKRRLEETDPRRAVASRNAAEVFTSELLAVHMQHHEGKGFRVEMALAGGIRRPRGFHLTPGDAWGEFCNALLDATGRTALAKAGRA